MFKHPVLNVPIRDYAYRGEIKQQPIRYTVQPIDVSEPVKKMKHGGVVYGRMPLIMDKKNLYL